MDVATIYVLLAMADRLLKRKLEVSPAIGSDLMRLLNGPPHSTDHAQHYEYLFQLFKHIEKSISRPIPIELRDALKQLRSNLSVPIPRNSWERRKKPKVSKAISDHL